MAVPDVARRVVVVVVLALASGCGDSRDGPSAPSGDLTVTSIVPDAALASETTPIQINGTGFSSGMQVRIDGSAIDANVVNPTTIAAVVRPHSAGTFDVVVGSALGRAVTVPGGFTYLPAVATVAISGNLVLARIGETSQLTATATFVDGSTRNVTTSTRWIVAQPSIASIGPDGLLVALSEGSTGISAQFPATGAGNTMRFSFAQVSVTPPGTFAVSGRTREPGAGNLNGVLVLNPASGRSVISNGFYTLAGLTDDRLSLTRDGFEPVEIRATRNGLDDVPMQRILRISAGGQAVTSVIAPNDTAYDVGGGTQCQPCRLIRITGSGSLTVRLTWTSPSHVLSIWVNGNRITASAGSQELVTSVAGGGEVIIYVGTTDSLGFEEHISFAISVVQ